MSMKRFLNDKHLLFYFLMAIAVLMRLLPHPINVTPTGALGLFAGAYLISRSAWLVPVAVLFLSDIFIGFYHPAVMLSVYASFALSAVLGRYLLMQKRTVMRVCGAAFGSATILFVLSNLTFWATGMYYPLTMDGLVLCYVMAIPFYGNTLAGNLFYAMLLFGCYEGIRNYLSRHNPLSAA